MKIPFTQLELAHVRKAVAGGVAAMTPLVLGDIHAHAFNTGRALDLVGAFVGGVLVVYHMPNKDLPEALKLADAFLGDVLPEAVPVVDEVAKVAEAVDVPAAPPAAS